MVVRLLWKVLEEIDNKRKANLSNIKILFI